MTKNQTKHFRVHCFVTIIFNLYRKAENPAATGIFICPVSRGQACPVTDGLYVM